MRHRGRGGGGGGGMMFNICNSGNTLVASGHRFNPTPVDFIFVLLSITLSDEIVIFWSCVIS